MIVNRIDTTTNRQGAITIFNTSNLTKTEYKVDATGINETNYAGSLSGSGSNASGSDAVVSAVIYTVSSTNHYAAGAAINLGNLGDAHRWTLELTCVQPVTIFV